MRSLAVRVWEFYRRINPSYFPLGRCVKNEENISLQK
jgi:hypothetical protein